MQYLRHLSLCKVLLALEIILTLALARMLVVFVPFARLAAWLSTPKARQPTAQTTDCTQIRRIGSYLHLLGGYTPWRSMCLEQAIAAWLLLQRRGWRSTLYLGVAKHGEELAAHAWLECAGIVVTGNRGKQHFTPIVQLGPAVHPQPRSG